MKNVINIKSKYLIISIISMIIVLVSGTFAFFNYQSKRSALVLTIGKLDNVQITIDNYDMDLTISPVLTYTSGAVSEITATNNGEDTGTFQLMYNISEADSELLSSSDMKYTVVAVTLDENDQESTEVVATGNFTTASVSEDYVIYEKELSLNETACYKVYTYLESTEEDQSSLANTTFTTIITAKILTDETYLLTASTSEGTIEATPGWTGSGSSATKTLNYDETYGTLPYITRSGYVLEGWYTAETGGTEVTSNTKMDPKNITIYARWREIEDNSAVVMVKKDGGPYNDLTVSLYSGTTSTYTNPECKNGAYIFDDVTDGTYNIYVNGTDINEDITVSTTGTTTVNYYTVTLNKGAGIATVSGEGTYLSGTTATISATTTNSYVWGNWTNTDTGVEISTENQYTATITGITSYTANGKAKTPKAIILSNNTEEYVYTVEYVFDDITYTIGDTYGSSTIQNVFLGNSTTVPKITDTTITSVNFNESFANYYPNDASSMFESFYSLGTITNIDNFKTTNVTNMSHMFAGASWSIGDLSNWDTSNVTDMSSMFAGAGAVATTWNIGNLSNWDTSNVTNMSAMFQEAGIEATTWSIGDLSNWNTSNVTNMESMFTDAGYNATTWSIGNLSNWDTSNVTNMSYMFHGIGESTTTWSIGNLSNWDISNVTNMSHMFAWAGAAATTWSIGNLSNWDTSKVTNMSDMFSSAGKSSTTWNIGDLNNWNTSNVTNMESMFTDAGYTSTTFNLNLSNWDASNVTTMSWMFFNAGYTSTTFNLNLSNWDASKVTNMHGMFYDAGYTSTTFNLNLSNWNISNVTDMSCVFYQIGLNSTLFNLDLSNWNTSKVTNMYSMFSGANRINTIYVGPYWNTSSVTNSVNMFSGATNLVGGNGTVYDSSYVDATYARIDGNGGAGYFTEADITAPTITLSSNGNATYAKTGSVTVTVADSLAGLNTNQNLKYGWSTSNTVAPTSYTSVTLTNALNDASTTFTATASGLTGEYYLWVVPDSSVCDTEDNCLTTAVISTGTFAFDNIIPTCSIVATPSSGFFTATTTATDTSGISLYGYKYGSQSSYTTTTNNFYTFTSVAEGTYTVTGYVEDEAGNSNTCSTSVTVTAPDFSTDSWATIVTNVKADPSTYPVGATKEITLTGFTNGETGSNGTYTIRVANNTTPSECATEGFSKTACGFVIEFVDIITEHVMNDTATNVGGWPASSMRTYINSTIYDALPSDLKNAIINTTVVSGYGSDDSSNFTSTDKLYLLSTHEVEAVATGDEYFIDSDTAYNNTRQLDYYSDQGVTTVSFTAAIKNYNGSAQLWWLRGADNENKYEFSVIGSNGFWINSGSSSTYGVAPAFRIAEEPTSFATDNWETIQYAVQTGNTSAYSVGDTREITLTGFTNGETDSDGKYTIRLVNKSTPSECSTEGFSQTACGFVIEFYDIITEHAMNDTDTNVGGWPASSLRTYVNSTIYGSLPSELQSVIINTTVVSGHGSTSSETNFTSTDKLYLLSAHEVYTVVDGDFSSWDTAYNNTRQLDYYGSQSVTIDSYSGAIHNYNGSAYY